MMSASSFVHYNRQSSLQQQPAQQPFSSTRSSINSRHSNSSQSQRKSLQSNSAPFASSSTSVSSPPSSPSTPTYTYSSPPSSIYSPQRHPVSSSTAASTPSPFSKWWRNKYDNSRQPESPPAVSSTPSLQIFHDSSSDKMTAISSVQPMAQPILMMKSSGRSSATTGPVQIPTKAHGRSEKPVKRQSSSASQRQRRSRPQDVRSPDSVPPSVMALLAMTDIPKPRRKGSQRQSSLEKDVPLTVNSIMDRVTDTELSFKLSKSPLDMLLLPPDELDCELDSPASVSDSDIGSILGPRTVSVESMPSLADSYTYGTPSSVGSWDAYSNSLPRPRSRKVRKGPMRPSLEPVSSPTGEPEMHPLSKAVNVDELDFRVFDLNDDEESEGQSESSGSSPFPSLVKSAFKSNLTASLRAIKNAAKSISAINFSSIPPDDFLTRSILTIDPKVPFTDERRPPVLEEEPSAALRRYLNPMTTAPMDARPITAATAATAMQAPHRPYTASIQMQTYKVYKSRTGSRASSGAASSPSASSGSSPSHQPPVQSPSQKAAGSPPGAMRQREMRENPDFIRVAVLEMAMRRSGKLDESVPGRARWALPPRKPNRACDVSIDGVPERWIPVVANYATTASL